jgi:hypothetical protein
LKKLSVYSGSARSRKLKSIESEKGTAKNENQTKIIDLERNHQQQ